MMTMTPIRSKGFSLIELLVALAIGLLITLVVTQAYLSGVGSQRAQTDLGRAQESSRFAFDLMARSLRKAGYKNPKAPGTGFCDSSSLPRLVVINDPATIKPDAINLVGSTVTVSNTSDAIRVRYYGDGLTSTPFTTDATMRDCLGNTIASNTLVSDTFFIAADTTNNNEPALFCYSSNATGSGSVPLVPGVESMQILYGEDTDGDGAVNRYVSGSSINTNNANNVRSVMLSLVARTANANAVDRSAQTIDHFGTNYNRSGDAGSRFITPADGRTRQHFSTTIALRNLCPV